MSTPTSTAEPIRQAALQAVQAPPVMGDPAMSGLHDAQAGAPLLASDEGGAPAFWLVPLLQGEHACGYVRVDLGGRVAQVSAFGAGPRDLAAWPQATYFSAPPQRLIDGVRARHPGVTLGAARFSFDASPARWAWRIAIGEQLVAYITPTGWYERPSGRR
ncbi:hypothetical protein [Roseateles sp. LYH14W]|uniref:Uncharacterized protein n=1 Tax=Pelomonas parva TaxID=3299032 RepID=A0ABW7F7M3_9BURK